MELNINTLLVEIALLKEKNQKLEEELIETKEHLKKYTAPLYKKKYYETNKEEIIEKIKEYKKTYIPTEEQKKKWAKTAYLKKKAKLEQEKQNI